jgi:hypothetical protein
MSQITHIIHRLEVLKLHAEAACEVIKRGDHEATTRLLDEASFNLTDIKNEIRRFSPKAFTSATEHLRK